MKAVMIEEFGGPEVLRYGDTPDPVAVVGQVVVDIHATSVNGADFETRIGAGRHPVRFPHIIGRDFSGVISMIGPEVSELEVGDEVFGVSLRGLERAYAEKIAVPADTVAKKPTDLGHVEAAAIGLCGLTASCALEDELGLQQGETILIQGGAGGAGGFAIQLAKHIGATVITTASMNNHDYVRQLGADHVIDYNTEDFTHIGPICDAVFDTVGGEVWTRSFQVIKPGGRIAWIGNPPKNFILPRPDVRGGRPNVVRDRAHLDRVMRLMAAGAIRPPAVTRFKLWQAPEAHRISQSRHLQGKLVFEVR